MANKIYFENLNNDQQKREREEAKELIETYTVAFRDAADEAKSFLFIANQMIMVNHVTRK